MQVQRYIFQSPYSSQVQIGRPDSSVKKETQEQNSDVPKSTNQTLQKAEMFQTTQKKEVTPTLESSKFLDLYA